MSEDQLKECVEETRVHYCGSPPSDGYFLNLSNKRLYSLNGLDKLKAILHSSAVLRISFAQNNLTSFDPSLLYEFHELDDIDLSHNKIMDLDKTIFYHNLDKRKYHHNHLKKISLAHNRFTIVDQNLCMHYPYLEKIDLSHNKITTLQKGVFCSMKRSGSICWQRIVLNVSDNQITTIEKNAFKKFFNGKIILDNNKLDESQIKKLRKFFKPSRLQPLGTSIYEKLKIIDTKHPNIVRPAFAIALVASIGMLTWKITNVLEKFSGMSKSTLIFPVFITVWLGESCSMCDFTRFTSKLYCQ